MTPSQAYRILELARSPEWASLLEALADVERAHASVVLNLHTSERFAEDYYTNRALATRLIPCVQGVVEQARQVADKEWRASNSSI